MPRRGLDDDRAELLAELRDLVSTGSGIPVATASQLTDRVDRDRRRIHEDLEKLELLEHAASLQAGARARVWWPTPHPWRDHGDEHGAAGGPAGGPVVDDSPDPEQREAVDVDELLEVNLPGSGDVLEQRRETILELRDHLRSEGTSRRSEFLELVDADRVAYDNAESFWRNCINGQDTLRELPGVVSPGEGGHTWRWSDPTD